jgi:hypothetical protein
VRGRVGGLGADASGQVADERLEFGEAALQVRDHRVTLKASGTCRRGHATIGGTNDFGSRAESSGERLLANN